MADSPDIVQRITQHIQTFQRSKVQLGEPLEVVMPAARVGDIINHTSFWGTLAVKDMKYRTKSLYIQ